VTKNSSQYCSSGTPTVETNDLQKSTKQNNERRLTEDQKRLIEDNLPEIRLSIKKLINKDKNLKWAKNKDELLSDALLYLVHCGLTFDPAKSASFVRYASIICLYRLKDQYRRETKIRTRNPHWAVSLTDTLIETIVDRRNFTETLDNEDFIKNVSIKSSQFFKNTGSSRAYIALINDYIIPRVFGDKKKNLSDISAETDTSIQRLCQMSGDDNVLDFLAKVSEDF